MLTGWLYTIANEMFNVDRHSRRVVLKSARARTHSCYAVSQSSAPDEQCAVKDRAVLMGCTVNASSAECTHLSDRTQRGDKPRLLLTELSKLRCPSVSTAAGIVA